MRAHPRKRFAVIHRFEILLGEVRVPSPQRLIIELDGRVGGHVAVTGRQRVIARPERHATFRRDQYETAVFGKVARRPRADHEQ